jgi:hypothetical protein
VWILGNRAYLGYYGCGTAVGSSVVDISDPLQPRLVFQTTPMSMTFSDDIEAITLDTASFKGDLFVEPHDRCARDQGPPAETRLWDMRGATPALIGSLVTGDGVHNAYPYQRGDRAFLLLAAPYADWTDNTPVGYEDIDLDADFVIVEITDPAQPTIVGKWNAHEELAVVPRDTFLHDIWANAAGTIAYASYWDAGMILLDISDVTAPRLVGQLNYPPPAAGNTHAVMPLKGEQFAVIADEDFSPTESTFEVLAPDAIAGAKPHHFGAFGRPLENKPPLMGEVVYVGRGCPESPPQVPVEDPYLTSPSGKIAAILRGSCNFSLKVLRAQQAGAIGAVIINNDPADGVAGLGGWDAALTIPAAGVSLETGNEITNTLTAGETVSVRMGILPGEWGFTRIADVSDPANPALVAEIVIPQTRQFPPEPGTWTVHNPWVDGDLLYLSHYWGGVRAYDVSNPSRPVELGHLIPADLEVSPGQKAHASVWGVMTDSRGYIYASDMTSGLWVLRRTQAPNQTATPTATVITAVPPQPTATPTAPPVPTPGGAQVCRHIATGKVPAAAIAAALANPAKVAGYNQPLDKSKPVHEIWNPRRLMLSIRAYSKPYHPMFNYLVFKAGCP